MTYQQGRSGSGTTGPDEVSRAIVHRIEAQGVLPEGVTARDAVSSVMCVLMGRLSGEEARHLLDALPAGFKMMLTRCAAHAGKPEGSGQSAFQTQVADHLSLADKSRTDAIARAVFNAVKAQLSESQISDVERGIPADLKELWRSAA